MKTKFLAFICLLLGVAYGCSDDDNNKTPGFLNDAVIEAFNKDFPTATNFDWEKKKDYFVVDFNVDKRELEAWYDKTGALILTEEDLVKSELPTAVISAFEASDYKEWKIDDIDKITRLGYDTIYIIEVEQGKNEVDLVYSEVGVLLYEMVDKPGNHNNEDYIPAQLPEEIKSYLDKNHSSARIVDVDLESTKWEVEIIEKDNEINRNVKKELNFTLDTKAWIQTEWEVKSSEVPAAIMQKIKEQVETTYAGWKIDDIDRLNNPKGSFFQVELEKSGEKDIKVLFSSTDGVLVELSASPF
ncbi:MAG: PepSY-like domain-containing protein [Bacteroides sp.]|nr:PepSY-like domain-containing protein [Bacteroides sp.]